MFGTVSPGGDGTQWIAQSGRALEEANDQVRWFRLGVDARTPVDLTIRLDCPANTPPLFIVSPKLAVLRDTTGASPGFFDFNLRRPSPEGNLVGNGRLDAGLAGWTAGHGDLRGGPDCYCGGCAEFAARGGPDQGCLVRECRSASSRGFLQLQRLDQVCYRVRRNRCRRAFGMQSRCGGWTNGTSSQQPSGATFTFRFQNDSCNPIGISFLKTTSDPGTLLIDEVVLKAFVPPGGNQPYTIAMLKAETDFSALRPLRAVFDSTGKADLQPVENTQSRSRCPWTTGPSGLGKRPHQHTRYPRRTCLAHTSCPIWHRGFVWTVDCARHRTISFCAQYRRGSGYFTFGARPLDESRYLAEDFAGAGPEDRETAFIWT